MGSAYSFIEGNILCGMTGCPVACNQWPSFIAKISITQN